MGDLFLDIFRHVTGDCGVTSLAFLVFAIWQTVMLGKERSAAERFRAQIVEEATARSRAAEAVAAAQREMVLRLIPIKAGEPGNVIK